MLPGQHSQNNNFIETLDTCPDDWDEWKFQHPGETADGNPDADAYDNFAEFAFAMPYDSGTGSPWLGSTAWIIQPSTLAPGTIEGVFVRPKGAPLNVTYTLQYAATLGDPTVWQSIVITLDDHHRWTMATAPRPSPFTTWKPSPDSPVEKASSASRRISTTTEPPTRHRPHLLHRSGRLDGNRSGNLLPHL